MTHYDEGVEDPAQLDRPLRLVPVTPRADQGCAGCRQKVAALAERDAEVQRLRLKLEEVGAEW